MTAVNSEFCFMDGAMRESREVIVEVDFKGAHAALLGVAILVEGIRRLSLSHITRVSERALGLWKPMGTRRAAVERGQCRAVRH
jgi:hypothetical protein